MRILQELHNLEILSLAGSTIAEIPITFSELIHLRLLDLNRCSELKLISSGVMRYLHRLEELYMILSSKYRRHDRAGDMITKDLLVMLDLPRLTTLEICIRDLSILSHSLLFQNLTKFILEIGYGNFDWNARRSSRNMMLSKLRVSEKLEGIKNLLTRTQNLVLYKINASENILQDLVNEGFNDLEYLRIHMCHEVQSLLNTSKWKPNLTFQNLED